MQLLHAQVFNPWGKPNQQEDIKPKFLRVLLSHLSTEIGIGYGSTRYFQNLDDQFLYSGNGALYLAYADSAASSYYLYDQWINSPTLTDTLGFAESVPYELNNTEFADDSEYIISQGKRRLRGGGSAIPVHIKGFISYNRFRIGGGASFELNTNADLSLKGYPEYINSYKTQYDRFFTTKYYFIGGVRYYDFWDYSYYVDLEYGKFTFSDAFTDLPIAYSKYWNLSFPIEKNVSEYFKLVVRPSVDFKSITTALPTAEPIKTKMWNMQVQLGIRMSFPLYRKCPIKNCEVQKEHVHIDKKFRGQPFYRKQNPKVGEGYPYPGSKKKRILGVFKRK